MKHRRMLFLSMMVVVFLAGCSGMGTLVGEKAPPPPTPAVPAKAVMACTDLNKAFTYANTTLTSVAVVGAGTLRVPGIAEPMPEHCLIKGKMNERKSPVDGKTYAIMPFGNEYIQEVDLSGIDRGDIKLVGGRKMIVPPAMPLPT